jgi:hypothetical protein
MKIEINHQNIKDQMYFDYPGFRLNHYLSGKVEKYLLRSFTFC